MTHETFNSRRPIKAELRIIHQYTDPNSTEGRTLSEIVKEVGSDQLILDLIGYRQGCDHYEEWKDHPNENVRLSLPPTAISLTTMSMTSMTESNTRLSVNNQS